MDFFASQELARRRTKQLALLFVAAVAAIVIAVYLAVCLLVVQIDDGASLGVSLSDPRLFLITAAITLGLIASGSAYKTAQLRAGGSVVARLLGGRPLAPNATDPAERRLLNIVEEMALAAGMPVPSVYVLPDERAINAFAAGFGPSDAVVAVTAGALSQLKRDELQGVIGHELSHVLNGDMRMNLRLLGLLHGILVIAMVGYWVLRTTGGSSSGSDSKKRGGGLALFGLALLAIGGIGVFFGRLIKAAVSRQREFLADAAAVQFTRNPWGLAGALRRIAAVPTEAKLTSPKAEEASHLFFADGMGKRLIAALSTHPPLAERIGRLEGAPVEIAEGSAPSATAIFDTEEEGPGGLVAAFAPAATSPAPPERRALDPAAVVASVGQLDQAQLTAATALLAEIPTLVREGAREPLTAQAIVLGLLLDERPEVRERQLVALRAAASPLVGGAGAQLQDAIARIPRAARLALVDLTLPALQRLSPEQYREFAGLVETLVRADERIGLFEFALQRLLRRHLAARFAPRQPARPLANDLAPLGAECALLLSALAWCGNADPSGASRDYAAGAAHLGEVGLPPAPRPRAECGLAGIDRALERLALLGPLAKRPLLAACAAAVACDGQVTVDEAELLRAIADALDCPLPPLPSGSAQSA